MVSEVGLRFIDSNIFIYLLLKDPVYGRKALGILLRFERGEELGATSTLVLSQVFSHLKKRGKAKAIDMFYEYVDQMPIKIVDTTLEDLKQAKRLKLELNLPWRLWDDLVIAAQMKRLGIEVIYSNDEDFDLIKGIKRVFL